MIRFRNPFWLVSAVLLVAGCGGSTTTGGGGATTPTVSVSASPSSITTAQSTTVTVTVSGTSGTPTGSVTLTSGSYSSGAQTLTNGTAQISIAAGTLVAGTHTLTASYTSTSSSYNNASGTGSVTVTSPTLLTPTVMVSASPSSITTAQSTTVTVTVSGTSGTPTGSVTLTSGSYNSGAQTLVNGSVQITVQGSSLATGSNTLSAAYTPDGGSSSTYNSASETGSVMVTAPSLLTPTVMVSASPTSITTAQSTTVTVTVSGTSGTPTGSVTLTSGSYNSGAKTLVNGSVQITVQGSSLATGSNVSLAAAYTPDGGSSSTYNSASGSGSVTVTTPTLLTPTVMVSPNPSSITTAQSTTVTVTVSGPNGDPTPTGSVTLTSGSYSSGAVTLSSGIAVITVHGSSLATGSNISLSAAYTPDGGSSSTYNSATGTGSVTVTSATQVTPTVTVTPNPSNIGDSQSTTVTVTVSGPNGDPTPTGSVTLTSGSYSSGAQTLVNGSVQIVVQGSSLTDGTDLLTAKYTPDTGSSSTYNNGTGITTVRVTGSLSITSFTASVNPIPVGQTSTQLTAVFAGGTGVITPGSNGTSGSISVTSGTPVTVSPTSTTVFTLTVTPATGSPITQTLTVTVLIGATVDFTTTYQTIRGFGGASVWLGKMPSAVATALFGSGPNDLNLSILRVRIDPTGSPTSTPPWVTTNGSGWSVEAANGQEAVANNPNAIVFASPWTPPPAWKLSGTSTTVSGRTFNEAFYSGTPACSPSASTCGGYLDPNHYADYANYLEDFVQYFNTTAGFNLYAISMQNEPEENVGYESCIWTPAQMDAWVAGYASTITSDAYSTKLIMPESDNFSPVDASPTLNDASAEGQVSIIGGHIYGVSPTPYSIPSGDTPKEIWMTEFGPLSNAQLTFAGALSPYGVAIHNSLVNGEYNAFVWWGAFGDAPGSCATAAGTCGFVDSAGNLQPMGEIMGQFSKFIQPGYVRASATANPTSGVLASAYTGSVSGTQHYVIVVINTNTSPVSISFNVNGSVTSMTPYQSTASAGLAQQSGVSVSGGQFTYTLPATSITTFVQ
jgi:O-glycosyl hydrolase